MEEVLGEELGHVVDYYAKVGAAGIQIEKGSVKKGDKIKIKGHTTDIEQTVDSMQIENKDAEVTSAPIAIGIKVIDRVRKGDRVYKITQG